MTNWLDSFLDGLFSVVFPKKGLVRQIEKMSAEEFLIRARKADLEIPSPFPIFALFSYKDPLVRLAIRELKYKKNRKIAKLFAQILSDRLPGELEDEIAWAHFDRPIIVPIPSHKTKRRIKGYNQTEFLLEELAKISPDQSFAEILPALIKTRTTEDQTYKKRSERLKNLRGCFGVKEEMKELIHGRNIIIFDDVVTTGGTLIEARRALKKAKARRVVGFALAH